ncbi:aspartyl/asparaginyl beta-hydroxylase domain-containing protein [Pseudoalteromonas piscicida]|uniref:aspartyl/asparaginyl beta-hydroxylase domain-containing protein n=1 Tax=Pseudoalteromonas piscicida TaxID=43662 RepID=UPI002738B0F0|nr:aspartyl/asparaginyl beta-hydroxylase domain-containing protein [Pseudoalteromonas piscicida]MDP4486386.1 aspartyl/asparaginyl beta-hydroxylase domain-containing protein [Pseudoalteromonas piscicida]
MCYFDGKIRQLTTVPDSIFEPLYKKVQLSSTKWDSINSAKPNNFQCFHSTEHIVFQFPKNLDNHLESYYTHQWENWKMTIQPLTDHVIKVYNYHNGRTARIMLAKLLPHSHIDLHIDQHVSADIPHKIHIPIITNKEVLFIEEDKGFHLSPKIAYEVNNKIMHGVINKSDQARIHLIFDFFDSP